MKSTLLFISCLLSMFMYAKEDLGSPYIVVSDKYDASIPKGKYILEGKAVDDNTGKNLIKVNVSFSDTKLQATGAKNYFSVTLPMSQTQIKFAKNGYKSSYFESYTVKEQHRIKIEIRLVSKEKVKDYPAEKPVLYCYSDRVLDARILLKTNGKMLFSYPQLSDSSTWIMHLDPNQAMPNANGQMVPYLFWESSNTDKIQFATTGNHLEGKVCTGSQATAYLDSTLSKLGFNAQEKTDFITYWGPRLSSKTYVFMHFLQDEQCEQFARYEISPAPDVFNRIFLVFTAYDHYPTELHPVKQNLEPLKRNGFNLLEWGGIEYHREEMAGF